MSPSIKWYHIICLYDLAKSWQNMSCTHQVPHHLSFCFARAWDSLLNKVAYMSSISAPSNSYKYESLHQISDITYLKLSNFLEVPKLRRFCIFKLFKSCLYQGLNLQVFKFIKFFKSSISKIEEVNG